MSDEFLGCVRVEGQKVKVLVKETSDVHCKMGQCNLRLHLKYHVLEDLDQFGGLILLSFSTFEGLTFILNGRI